ncbi:hypothetical protein [Celeribacter arenosi]
MKNRRWMKSMIAQSKKAEPGLPWERAARSKFKASVARRQGRK